ncbi:hypothetical protein M2168_006084 [Streptomyces sp. CZ24]|nr:hypothetical protein [Streptomyces sp. CZ24]
MRQEGPHRSGHAAPRRRSPLARLLFAVGCPVGNKLVLVLLGASGAMSCWAPPQPLLAVLSVGLPAEAALRRRSSQTECAVPASA